MKRTKGKISKLLGASAIALALVVSGCSAAPEEAPDDTVTEGPHGTLRFGLDFEPSNWDTQTQPGESVQSLVYEGLLGHAADGVTIVPELAVEWELTPTEASFVLKEGVKFHDGTPLTADAVVQTLEFVKGAGSRWSAGLRSVSEFSTDGENKVILTLSTPSPTLLQNLTSRGMHIIAPAALADGSYVQSPVGTGPYQLDVANSVPGSVNVFEVFPEYHDLDAVGPKRIEMHFIADANARYQALLTGQLDAAGIGEDSVSTAQSQGFDTHTWTTVRHHLLILDREGVFGDVLVRQAMCHAMPQADISLAQYSGNGSIHSQRFNPGDPAYIDALQPYSYDLTRAQQLMDQAGNPQVKFQLPHGTGQSPMFELIRESFGKVGIEVELIPMENSQYYSVFFTGDYPLIYNTSTSEDPGMATYYNLRFAQDGGGNPFKATPPPALAAAMEAGLNAETADEQSAKWKEMTQIIHDEALDCGYFNVPQTVALNADVVTNLETTVGYPTALRWLEVRVK